MSDAHRTFVDEALAAIDMPAWDPQSLLTMSTARAARLRPDAYDAPTGFWNDASRIAAAGHIVGLVLLRLPGEWVHGLQSLRSTELRAYEIIRNW